MDWLRQHRLELKYALLAVVLMGGIVWLDRAGQLDRLASAVSPAIDALAGLGLAGAFLLGLVGNSSVLLQVPYTVPMLSAALAGAPLTYLVALAVAAGLGATAGEVVSYAIADQLLRRSRHLSDSRLYRWVDRMVRTRPRSIPWLVFVWAATLLPDDTVLIPLAMIRYGARRLLVPLLVGKLFYTLMSAWLFHVAGERAARLVSQDVTGDLAVVALVAFLLMVFYQVERARRARRAADRPSAR